MKNQPKPRRNCDWMSDRQLTLWIEHLSSYLGQALEEQRVRTEQAKAPAKEDERRPGH